MDPKGSLIQPKGLDSSVKSLPLSCICCPTSVSSHHGKDCSRVKPHILCFLRGKNKMSKVTFHSDEVNSVVYYFTCWVFWIPVFFRRGTTPTLWNMKKKQELWMQQFKYNAVFWIAAITFAILRVIFLHCSNKDSYNNQAYSQDSTQHKNNCPGSVWPYAASWNNMNKRSDS